MKLSPPEKHRRGKILRALREAAGLTQADMAQLLSPKSPYFMRTYQNWELGKTWNPVMEKQLAQLFQVPEKIFSDVDFAERYLLRRAHGEGQVRSAILLTPEQSRQLREQVRALLKHHPPQHIVDMMREVLGDLENEDPLDCPLAESGG